MKEQRERFDRWLESNMPTVILNMDISTHDPRWGMAKARYDELWRVWSAADNYTLIADLTTKLAAAEERVKELEKPEKTCKWTDTGAIYNTECGHRWMFEAGDIADNGVKFCPYCAGKIDAAIERSE